MNGFNLPDTWMLDHIHVHWGEDDSKGSEHYLDGKQYAGEVGVCMWDTAKDNKSTIHITIRLFDFSIIIWLMDVISFKVGPKMTLNIRNWIAKSSGINAATLQNDLIDMKVKSF